MVAVMALPAHVTNYLSRIGALWTMPINALLSLGTLFAAAISEQEVPRGHSKMDGDCVAFETDYWGEAGQICGKV